MFTPSKTALNGINFLTKEEENNLQKKEQIDDVLDIFRVIYIVLNESFENIQNKDLIENLFVRILPKFKVENLSKYIIVIFRNFIYFIYS